MKIAVNWSDPSFQKFYLAWIFSILTLHKVTQLSKSFLFLIDFKVDIKKFD